MGRASGAGMPITFVCPVARRNRATWSGPDRGRLPDGHDRIVRTGATKPRTSRVGSARSQRSLDTAYEYRCECGHVGWTTHVDVLRRPVSTT